MKLTYAELLEAQLYDAPSHTTEQQTRERLEAEIVELRRQVEVERSTLRIMRNTA